jgi:hypothetical protein
VLDGIDKARMLVLPTGVYPATNLDDIILSSFDTVTQSFLRDADDDRLPAALEFLNNCSDLDLDSDDDGLYDNFEVSIGRSVKTATTQGPVYSRCWDVDSDGDDLDDPDEAGRDRT